MTGLLWLFVIAIQTPLAAQVITIKPSDEPITLDLDSAVAKRLATVEDFIAEKQWDVVVGLLRQTQAEKPDKLVPIAPGWYVSAARYCQCRAALLPPAGLAAYRKQVDATAQKWLADAEHNTASVTAHDRTPWLKIVRQAFASSSGDAALSRLAEQSFEAGDFASARTSWELLLPASGPLRSAAGIGLLRHPDSSFDAAQVRAHLVLCSLFEGNVSRAERELAALRRLHADAVGHLAGRDGVLAELLAQQMASVRMASGGRQTPDASGALDSHVAKPQLDRPMIADGRGRPSYLDSHV
ncbi:MAG TPA: hypothetical protein VK137_08210, partial [Planctomycetaceae bacterium]|nr:hypothetical protein [Planctomycetaceae bacterium]